MSKLLQGFPQVFEPRTTTMNVDPVKIPVDEYQAYLTPARRWRWRTQAHQ
jgi:hypothetical protein